MMQVNRILASLVLAVLATSQVACVSSPVSKPNHDELTLVLNHQARSAPLVSDGQRLLELSPAMREFAHRYVPKRGSANIRLRELLRALDGVRGIEYEIGANLTAQQAFEQRRANCLAFSSLVIAMAKEVGIEARFQEVDLPPSWEGRNSDLLLRLRHVNVITNVREVGSGFTVVDFQRDRYDESFPRQALSNDQGVARFYNNIAIDALLNEEYERALAHILAALDIDPELDFAWVNLGQVYRRMGDNRRADISYRQALALSPKDPSALANLAKVYAETGQLADSQTLISMANRHRERDPYFNFAMAQRAYARDELGQARAWLDRALQRRWKEHRFHHLMAMVQWDLGERQQAKRSMRDAVDLASELKDRAQYRQQLAEWDTAISAT